MIPVADLEVDPSFPAYGRFGLPDPEEISEEGFGFFRDTWHLGDVSHEEALAVVDEERHLVDLVDEATTSRDDSEAVAGAIESTAPDSLPPGFAHTHADSEILDIVGDGQDAEPVLDCLEIGVAGLSYVLTSIGCVTAASCRGHSTDHAWTHRPVVFFAAERTTVHWLTPLVRVSGSGFADGSGHGRLIAIEAPCITNLMDLASRILFSTPGSRPGWTEDSTAQERLW